MANPSVSAEPDTRSPGWRRIVLFAITLVVGAGCAGLGIWQTRRLLARRAANHVALAARALPPIDASLGTTVLRPQRRAAITGTLDQEREFLLRNRLVRGVPAVVVVTPVRVPGSDSALLVNRGYVPAANAVDPGGATWREESPRTFRGVLLPVPDRGDGNPVVHEGRESWFSLDLSAMRARLPYPVASLYLVAEPIAEDGPDHTIGGKVYPFRAEPPPLDEGPHLMYAVQWFGIAAAVIGFGVVFVLRGGPRGIAPLTNGETG